MKWDVAGDRKGSFPGGGVFNAGGAARRLGAACLVLFPLLFVPAGTQLHPSLGGDTAAEQVGQLAAQAPRWRMVHLTFGVAALLAVGAVAVLWRLTANGFGDAPELKAFTAVAGLVGTAGALALAWVGVWEARVVPDLARACASSRECVDAANPVFVERLAEVGWRHVPGLLAGGVALAVGLFLLGPLGWRARALRPWEGLGLALGATALLVLAPSIHGGNAPGLLLVLLATGSIAFRLLGHRVPADDRGDATVA